MRGSYCGPSYDSSCDLDAELVETVITKMKRGKAAGLDGHLQYSHPLVACMLSKLFSGMVKLEHVPASFGQSYTVPLPNTGSSAYGKSVTVNDFRGMSISPVKSKNI